jgi:phosphopantothenoylcysteine decarboxylase/phosphopantothenate--cysteine ligase
MSSLQSSLQGREILLGVTGGIACYKGVEVLRGLKRAGAEVTVAMTPHAREFVAPLTFQTLSNRPVITNLFDLDQESRIGHIQVAEQAELALVAPCTANTAARLRAGIADEPVSTILLATTAPVYLALAMNDNMLRNPATQDNLAVLAQRGVYLIEPAVGFLAEGKDAVGRLAEPADIVARIERHFAAADDTAADDAAADNTVAEQGRVQPLLNLRGRRVLVTAGPTVEPIDPVRFISNRSSGRMGYNIAEVCRDAGAKVTLVKGPVHLPDPQGMEIIAVKSAADMREAVLARQHDQDVLIFAAAVADYRAAEQAPHKIKREGHGELVLSLQPNPDISRDAGGRKRPGQVHVVFAAESQDLIANAEKKLRGKHADLVVANDITEAGSGFESHQNRVTLIRMAGDHAMPPVPLPLMDKRHVAMRIMQEVSELLHAHAGRATSA